MTCSYCSYNLLANDVAGQVQFDVRLRCPRSMVVIKISFNGWDNLRRAVVGISKCRSGPIQPAAVDAMRKTPQMFLTQTHLEQVVHVGCAYLGTYKTAFDL